ncbi:glycosyltransferase family 4 protein [Priestia taiwanensis]|uniref:Glycosyltransferase family 1 protein n=1 Tax=Priestia taiwanensis TaxID=1347902 RepID=A0A917AUQ9_9BACI|nr:glycosyltransferase family 4 protein [Priestia taiwanensis]MBM7364154.1 glycosyltransferase involved in cell wall biosynthesis [Priestia taiwanensis]GGE72060.1 hypothetical protein GCM10007140_22500 [Priestia taiwanensis]
MAVFHESLVRVMDIYYGVAKEEESILVAPKYSLQGRKSGSLNILYVTFLRYPNTGGLSNYITSLQMGMKRRGHQVDVFSPVQMPPIYFDTYIPEAAKEARSFLKERYNIENEKLVKNSSYLHAFTRFLRNQSLEEYDVIHAEDLFALFLLGQMKEVHKKPLFFTPHGYFTRSRMKFGKIRTGSIEEAYFTGIEKQGIHAADKIITISDSFHLPLREYGATDEQLVTVHTGIDFYPVVSTEEDHLVIVSVARLAPRKGHDLLIEAVARMQEELEGVEVWIVGDGVRRQQLEKEVKKKGLQQVKFLGRREDVANVLAASTIYVLPTLNDNFPISIIEAMFAGKAIITTTCGGIVEMIQHGETGLLCEPGNVEQLIQALRLLLTNKALRNKLGKQAHAYAKQHFTQEDMAAKMETIYRSFS